MSKKIKITCSGSSKRPISELLDFQGNLKTLESQQLKQLKRSILKYGFSFPVFVWGDYILDGHQRIFATKKLVEDGYSIADIPVVEVEAKNRKEAAEKLLELNSRFGEMSDAGLFEFLSDNMLDIDDLEVNLPDVDLMPDMEDVKEKTAISDAEPSGKRDLGDSKKKIRPVLYAKDISVFEEAIQKTGMKNYAEAVVFICGFYLKNREVPGLDI